MHQMAEFMEESHHVFKLHEPRIARRSTREITDQRAFGQMPPVDAEQNRVHAVPLVLARARVHIQIEATGHSIAVVDVPRGD